jgi:hypothetical protein
MIEVTGSDCCFFIKLTVFCSIVYISVTDINMRLGKSGRGMVREEFGPW